MRPDVHVGCPTATACIVPDCLHTCLAGAAGSEVPAPARPLCPAGWSEVPAPAASLLAAATACIQPATLCTQAALWLVPHLLLQLLSTSFAQLLQPKATPAAGAAAAAKARDAGAAAAGARAAGAATRTFTAPANAISPRGSQSHAGPPPSESACAAIHDLHRRRACAAVVKVREQ